jgi:NADPH:quinone reductase-like Zn-dependent oxidoreductase
MRAAGIHYLRGPVELLQLPRPAPPSRDELLIHVRSAGVGPWDRIVADGGWDVGREPPLALGVEAAGTVEEAGDASGFSVGDHVLTHPVPLRHQGCWAEYLLARAELTAHKPDELTWAEAAALPIPALTAVQVVEQVLRIQAGERVFVHGAGGVTGSLILQLALSAGADVIATAGPSSAARALGAREVIDYHRPDWPEEIRALTDLGFDVAINAVPGEAARAATVVRHGGRLATITQDLPPGARGIEQHDVYVSADGSALARVAELAANGSLELQVAACFPVDKAAEALTLATSGHTGGAVILTFEQ